MAVAMARRGEGVKLRPLKPSEVDLLHELWVESGLSFRPRGRDRLVLLREQRRRTPDLFIGAFVGRKMVGAVIASDDGRRGWINRLAVHPSSRGMGVAKALIAQAERALRKRGRHLFCIHVESDNEVSMKLFERVGYGREREILYFTKRELLSY